jgi:hypothetical protein
LGGTLLIWSKLFEYVVVYLVCQARYLVKCMEASEMQQR